MRVPSFSGVMRWRTIVSLSNDAEVILHFSPETICAPPRDLEDGGGRTRGSVSNTRLCDEGKKTYWRFIPLNLHV